MFPANGEAGRRYLAAGRSARQSASAVALHSEACLIIFSERGSGGAEKLVPRGDAQQALLLAGRVGTMLTRLLQRFA